VTGFFIPGVSGDLRVVEDAYAGMRRELEHEMGRPPTSRRIYSLWARRGGIDCVTEVGTSDPLRGGTVVAIFDMGRHQPFVVWRQRDSPNREEDRETLGANVYSVLEFDT
jgi:hypothetical protein